MAIWSVTSPFGNFLLSTRYLRGFLDGRSEIFFYYDILQAMWVGSFPVCVRLSFFLPHMQVFWIWKATRTQQCYSAVGDLEGEFVSSARAKREVNSICDWPPEQAWWGYLVGSGLPALPCFLFVFILNLNLIEIDRNIKSLTHNNFV